MKTVKDIRNEFLGFFEQRGHEVVSFGDYFKEDAIAMAWELVTKNFALSPEKLCVTVHSTDEEAAAIWKKVTGFSDDKIIRIPTDDNFWRMGDTGPCGPCTEIFYDHGEHIWGGPPGTPEEDGDRFIEIWNNVFMQYEQIDAETRIDLPAQSVDTGMGLERIAATLMGSNNNYDIDIMQDLIKHSADLTGVAPDGDMAASHKVIADHLRAASFLMADGVMPSNEGRGYVLRRIMRRGMRHAHLLGAKDPMMHQIFPTLLGNMGEAYPELRRAESLISQTLEMEEKRFKATLDRGLKLLEEETSKLSGKTFPGDVAFKLYDTFGFPLDLTQDALKAQEIDVDVDAFNACMEQQKAAARAAWSGSGDVGTDALWFDIADVIGTTEFLGYDSLQAEAQIVAIVKDGARVDTLSAGDDGIIITNQTPFYGESGGQVGDHGALLINDNELVVSDTQKQNGLHLHVIKSASVATSVGEAVVLRVDEVRRDAIQSNHSATHLLHEALRRVLGDHVAQKGSLQDEVEAIVNEEISENTAVETRLMALDDARETGAMALFGEKYADEVRVVSMGSQGAGKQYSVELCGGTHVKRTGDIGALKIISEGSLSSGVRRIEAVTGERVKAYQAQKQEQLQGEIDALKQKAQNLGEELSSLGGDDPAALSDNKDELVAHIKTLQKKISQARLSQGAESSGDDIEDIGGVKFIGKVLNGFPAKGLKPLADKFKSQLGSGVVVLVATDESKASIVVGVTADISGKISAVDLSIAILMRSKTSLISWNSCGEIDTGSGLILRRIKSFLMAYSSNNAVLALMRESKIFACSAVLNSSGISTRPRIISNNLCE